MRGLARPLHIAIVVLAALGLAQSAASQDHRLWVGFDMDLDDTTGCSLEAAEQGDAQTVNGFEWQVEVTVTPSSPAAEVVRVEALACDDAETRDAMAWARHEEDAQVPWSVGIGNGEDPGTGDGPGDVVELGVDVLDWGFDDQARMVVVSQSAGGHRDMLLTTDGSSGGDPILFPSVVAVPALSPGAWGLLVLLLAVSVLLGVRRSPAVLALWIVLAGVSAERAVASISLVLDGEVGDWGTLLALASDPAEDSETADPSADLLTLYADWNGTQLALRIDVADLSAEVCDHASTPCTTLSPGSGDSLATVIAGLAANERLRIEAGDYALAGKAEITAAGVQVLAEEGVTLHNTIAAFRDIVTGDEPWEVVDGALGIYRSVEAYAFDPASDSGHAIASGRFDVGDEAFMLIPYACYATLASSDYFYPEDESTLSEPPACGEKPYIGPGIYWDQDGSQAIELNDGSDAGHLFIRMDTSPEPLNSLVTSEGWTISADPNEIDMDITIEGPRLQLGADDIVLSNLTLEMGSIRIGGGTQGGELRDVVLDGPTHDTPIEIYTGASHVLLDGIRLDRNFPAWITWKDTKKLFYETIRHSAISLNGRDEDDRDDGVEAIHDITLRNSTIQNVHDGLELNGDAYHHLAIFDNTFINVQDDAIQLGSTPYEIEIAGNTFTEVGTGVSRHATGANDFPGYKYIHHNIIDASTPKYYCREIASGDYGEGTTCDSEGKLTLRGFNLHEGDEGWGVDGDPRYIYNNTVIVNGQMLGIGFQGQSYSDELPYGDPSLVFNNVFVQLDNVTSSFVESPKWSIVGPPVLITGGNLYYQPEPPYACYGTSFPGELGHTYTCDPDAVDDPCNRICVEGDDAKLAQTCATNAECNSTDESDGRCSSGAVCQMTERVFEMSGKICGLDDFQDSHCDTGSGWSPQLGSTWQSDYASPVVVDFSWGLEEGGLQDDSALELTTYVPGCDWLDDQLDASNATISPIDLGNIDGAYTVSADGVQIWELSLSAPLPGIEAGDPYRGAVPCE